MQIVFNTDDKKSSSSAFLLRSARGAAGLTQAEVADRAGIKEQQYQRYERANYRGHKLDMMVKLLWAMGFDMSVKFEPIEPSKTPKAGRSKK